MPHPQHDGLLWISTGLNRKELKWKNTEISWHDLRQRLSRTVITPETWKEYIAFDKTIQAEKKDVGGFVGGIVQGGRRVAGSVMTRYLATLDIDFGDINFWSDFILQYDCAAAIYGTHKHHPDAPRYRLVIPFNREVFTDEYGAISRKIAESMGIDLFDTTTFQPERLMYWPSTPKDVEYYYKVQDGPFLDVDAVLGLYADWKDTSQWAVSSKAKAAVVRSAEKQGDPLEKKGVIGAFCRTYSVTEVIETYLHEVYIPTDDPERYTFTGGSTAAGLILYEDKFAYSHHGTDPVSGRLCNAFDLVRVHRFGKLDGEVKPDTPINRWPSHLAMEELGLDDKNVAKEMMLGKLKEASFDFADVEAVEMDWIKLLKMDHKGKMVLPTTENIYLILANDPHLKDCFMYNAFENKDAAMKDLPWRPIKRSGEFTVDADDAGLRTYLEKNYGIYTVGKTMDAFRKLMMEQTFHPVLDYLKGLNWDGAERLDRLVIDYLGAEDSVYVRAVTRKAFVAAVARVFRPGIKFDTVLTLVGPQGCGKSTLLNRMGRGWFSDSLGSIDNDKIAEQLQGVWIMEIAELSGFKKADVDRVKHFVAKREDRFRVAYGRKTENFPRQCVFFGTTNKTDFLSDQTGNRRFWAVQVGVEPGKSVFDDLTPGVVNQLWAEAVHYWYNDEQLYLSRELEDYASKIQEFHMEKDPREETMLAYLDRLLPADWAEKSIYERREWLESEAVGTVERYKISPIEIWCELFGKLKEDASYRSVAYIKDYLGRLKNWEKRIVRTDFYGNQRGFVRTDNDLL